MAALPMLLLLRNRARCRTRLLFYSDTSATLCLWWALLRPGDRIVAPTESARRTIEFVCADVAPYLRVYGYPMPLPPKPAIASTARAPVLTSMTRMTRTKLLHRQIEALRRWRRYHERTRWSTSRHTKRHTTKHMANRSDAGAVI